jgi:hypothetical protein
MIFFGRWRMLSLPLLLIAVVLAHARTSAAAALDEFVLVQPLKRQPAGHTQFALLEVSYNHDFVSSTTSLTSSFSGDDNDNDMIVKDMRGLDGAGMRSHAYILDALMRSNTRGLNYVDVDMYASSGAWSVDLWGEKSDTASGQQTDSSRMQYLSSTGTTIQATVQNDAGGGSGNFSKSWLELLTKLSFLLGGSYSQGDNCVCDLNCFIVQRSAVQRSAAQCSAILQFFSLF